MTTTTAGRAPVSGGELAYWIEGAGRPVVLAHAGLIDSRMWDDLAADLREDHLVVRYDARAHGRSSTPRADWSWSQDMADVIAHVGLHDVTIVGLCLGSLAAVDYALAHPDNVRALVLAAPNVSGWVSTDPLVHEAHARRMERAMAMDLDGYVEAVVQAGLVGPRRSTADVDPLVLARVTELARDTAMAHHSAQGQPTDDGAVNRLTELARHDIPALAVIGDLDYRDAHDLLDTFAAALPDLEVQRFAEAAHLVNLDAGERFTRAVREFLART